MSFSDLASLGSFVNGLAVLVSLVFLYFQLRQVTAQIKQAEKNQQASIRHSRISRVFDLHLAVATGETSVGEAQQLGMWGMQDISEPHLQRFLAIARATFLNSEDTYYLHSSGLVDDPAFETFVGTTKQLLSAPGYRIAWRTFRRLYGGQFRTFMDKLHADVRPAGAPLISLAQWKIDMAAEKAAALDS